MRPQCSKSQRVLVQVPGAPFASQSTWLPSPALYSILPSHTAELPCQSPQWRFSCVGGMGERMEKILASAKRGSGIHVNCLEATTCLFQLHEEKSYGSEWTNANTSRRLGILQLPSITFTSYLFKTQTRSYNFYSRTCKPLCMKHMELECLPIVLPQSRACPLTQSPGTSEGGERWRRAVSFILRWPSASGRSGGDTLPLLLGWKVSTSLLNNNEVFSDSIIWVPLLHLILLLQHLVFFILYINHTCTDIHVPLTYGLLSPTNFECQISVLNVWKVPYTPSYVQDLQQEAWQGVHGIKCLLIQMCW